MERRDLEIEYTTHVSPNISLLGLALISDGDLLRYVCQAIFVYKTLHEGVDRPTAVAYLHRNYPVSTATIYRWIGNRSPELTDYIEAKYHNLDKD